MDIIRRSYISITSGILRDKKKKGLENQKLNQSDQCNEVKNLVFKIKEGIGLRELFLLRLRN